MVALLLDRGVVVDTQNRLCQTPLHKAFGGSPDEDVIKLLLDRGAAIDAKDSEGKTPVDYSKSDRDSSIMSLLQSAIYKKKGDSPNSTA